ncbi:hypothetical protein AB3S75_002042 [Citrus x aurantiifolia]
MAVAFVGGALLGAVFGELLRAVSEAKDKAVMFKDLLGQLESTLQNSTPMIKEIEKLNQVLDLPKHETDTLIEMMRRGEHLVHKCSRVKWNCFKRYDYAKKIIKLDRSIDTFFRTYIPLQQTRDNRVIMVDLKEVHMMVKRLSGNDRTSWMFNQVGVAGACSAPDPPPVTPGLDVPLKELKLELFKDGRQVIVVSAPGGYGKTTLVKKLCKDDQVLGKFKDNIFFVTVSQTPNVKGIVQKVFQHKGYAVPEFQTDEDAINDLERLLKPIRPEAILLVLDDVWSGSESLLQKFKFQLPYYKILVTSRSVFPQFGSGYDLKPLNDEAARTLFRYSANLQDGNSYIPDENLVNKILRACKGCPLALTVVGGSLCGKHPAIWQKRVKEWTQDVSVFHSNKEILSCLERSLDALNNEVKECYMDLCSFPEDQRIPITALVDMWMELYEPVDELFAIANLHELSNLNLANCVVTRKYASDDSCYNDHFVMQHDLLRELAIYQSKLEPIKQRKRLIIDMSGNNFPEWWMDQKQHPLNASLLSISTDETFSSNWYDMEAPEVKVVVLNIRTKKYTLPKFLEKMDKLKVMIVTNYGFFPAELSNIQVFGALSNLKRIRLEHVSLPSLTTVRMQHLQNVSLVMCSVGQVVQNSTFHFSDAFPNLLEIDIDYCNDLRELPDGLCDIVSIKKLRITNCHKLSALPEGIGKLVNLQMLTLASCTDLSALPDTIGNLSNLNFLDISECLNIQELPEQIGELCSLKTLCLKGCSIFELPSSILKLENLEVVKCDEETAYQWEYFQLGQAKFRIEVIQEDINLYWLHNPHL